MDIRIDAAGWIGVDLDGTLAHYDTWRGELHIGAPVPLMLARVRRWVAAGRLVKVVTARASYFYANADGTPHDAEAVHAAIHAWCLLHVGCTLEITDRKDRDMVELWDDRVVQVVKNTGERADGADEDPLTFEVAHITEGEMMAHLRDIAHHADGYYHRLAASAALERLRPTEICNVCAGTGCTDNHVTGPVDCDACGGTGMRDSEDAQHLRAFIRWMEAHAPETLRAWREQFKAARAAKV